MNFILPPPSLEHRALVKIGITLWSQGDFTDVIPNLYCLKEFNWYRIDQLVAEKVSKLPLPALINENLLDITQQVGFEIMSWMECHLYCNNLVNELLHIFVWTPHGTIDNKKTAEILVKDETIDIGQRFSLASAYCLKDAIFDLRRKFELRGSMMYDDDLIHFWSDYCVNADDKEDLANFWSYYYKRQWSNIFDNRTKYEKIIKYTALFKFNEAATRYFFLKVRHQNNETAVAEIAKDIAELLICRNRDFVSQRKNDVIIFLLSIVSAEQQAEIFQRHAYEILISLLVWPWQSLFLEMANDKWNFLSKQRYEDLLYNIIIRMSRKCSHMKQLFLEFWQQTPESYKQFVMDKDGIGHLLLNLCRTGNERTIKVILKDSSVSARKDLIFSDKARDIFKYLVHCEKWNIIEYLLQECISSLEEISKFKDYIKKNATSLYPGNIFLQMVEDFITTYKKESV